jgi:hypothetical protein
MRTGSRVLWRCSAPPANLPRLPQLSLARNSLVKKKCETVCCVATASSFVTKVRRDVFADFHTVTIKRHTVCGIDCLACRDEFFVNNPWMLKKMMSMLLTLLFTCLPRTIVKLLPGSPSHFFWDFHKIWCCSFVESIEKSYQARRTTTDKRT